MNKRIRTGLVFTLCIFSLAAFCSCSGAADKEKDTVIETTAQETQGTAASVQTEKDITPAKPEGLSYKYSASSKQLQVKWNAADNAVKYQIKCGNIDETVTGTSCTINNVGEGAEGTIQVRSINSKGVPSDWSSVKFTIEVRVDAPSKLISQKVDGSYDFVFWNAVDGATSYEVKYYSSGSNTPQTKKVTGTSFGFKINEGTQKEFEVRAVKSINGKDYTSDWKKLSFTFPTFKDLKEYSMYESCTLDYDRLVKYAKGNSDYVSMQNWKDSDGKTLVELQLKDPDNSGIVNGLVRAVKAYFTAAVNGYASGIKENVWSTVRVSSGIKDYFMKLDEAATEDAEISGGIAAFKAAFMNTNIKIVYQYDDTNAAPEMCVITMLKSNRKDYADYYKSKYKLNENGFYHFYVPGSEQNYYQHVGEAGNAWMITLYAEKQI